MFMALMSILIIGSAALLGGKLGHLANIHLRRPVLIVFALVVQILITVVFPDAPKAVLVGLHLTTYAAAAIMLWANRALPGLVLIGLGAASNAAVIALNGGTLPASAHALAAAGQPVKVGDFANSGVLTHPVLPWLGDVLATPSWLPLRNVISVGDMIILCGTLVLVHSVSRSRLSPLLALVKQSPPQDASLTPIGRRAPIGRHRAGAIRGVQQGGADVGLEVLGDLRAT